MAIWNEDLSKLKRDRAPKNYQTNQAWALCITDKKEDSKHAKCADAFNHDYKGGFRLVSSGLKERKQRSERNESQDGPSGEIFLTLHHPRLASSAYLRKQIDRPKAVSL